MLIKNVYLEGRGKIWEKKQEDFSKYFMLYNFDFGDKCFRYGAYANNDWEEFKIFLKDCYSHRKNMEWY